MQRVYMDAFTLGVVEELEKFAEASTQLQTMVPGETPDQFLQRVRAGKYNFPQFMQNAQQHSWRMPGVPLANTLIHKFLASNKDKPGVIKNKIQAQDDATLLKVINRNPDAFRGVQNTQPQNPEPAPVQPVQPGFGKVALDMGNMPVNENIFPSLGSQAKWKYARTKDGLKLSDGNLVYSFGGFPEHYPSEDVKVSRAADDNILNFENDALSKGTAQIHRSSPDNVYMTLADGSHNPTFMLQHEEGKTWRYTPSKKFVEKLKKLQPLKEVSSVSENKAPEEAEEPAYYADSTLLDPASLFAGARDAAKTASFAPEHGAFDSESAAAMLKGLVHRGQDAFGRYADYVGEHPAASAIGTYAALKGVDALRTLANPERDMERVLNPRVRTRRELWPVAASLLPSLAAMAYKAQ